MERMDEAGLYPACLHKIVVKATEVEALLVEVVGIFGFAASSEVDA